MTISRPLILMALVASAAFGLIGCTPPPAATSTTPPEPSATSPAATEPAEATATPAATAVAGATLPPDEAEALIAERADAVLAALKAKDMAALAEYVDPEKGVRFSPYTFVNDTDLVFGADELAALPGSTDLHEWGTFDGSGEPIQLTYDDYDARFIYSLDFQTFEDVGYNRVLKTGNTINNTAEFYPGSIIVEYHFPGSPTDYSGMDWQSLRLVFQDTGGVWYLVGVVHDGWTI
jgi:hypothetical protein